MPGLIARHNRDFTVCGRRWFEALHKGKYEYMGEFDLMSLAFRLDYSLYVWGVAEQAFHYEEAALGEGFRNIGRIGPMGPMGLMMGRAKRERCSTLAECHSSLMSAARKTHVDHFRRLSTGSVSGFQ